MPTTKQDQAYFLENNDPFFSEELAGILAHVLNIDECKALRKEIADYKNGLIGRIYKTLAMKIEEEGIMKTKAFILQQHDSYTAAMTEEIKKAREAT